MDLKELQTIASLELAKHGLHDWNFGFTDAKRMLGVCKYRQKRIEIAEYYALNSSRESILDTLLHEIAHALAGSKAGHGPAWQEIAVRLGATPRACDKTGDAVTQPGDWQATCTACKRVFHRYQRPRSLTGYVCRCPARSPLVFEFMGDPSLKPMLPPTVKDAPHWEAICAGCATVHMRLRRPKAAIWRCKCAARSELQWQFRLG